MENKRGNWQKKGGYRSPTLMVWTISQRILTASGEGTGLPSDGYKDDGYDA